MHYATVLVIPLLPNLHHLAALPCYCATCTISDVANTFLNNLFILLITIASMGSQPACNIQYSWQIPDRNLLDPSANLIHYYNLGVENMRRRLFL